MTSSLGRLDELVTFCASTADIGECIARVELELELRLGGRRAVVYLLERENCWLARVNQAEPRRFQDSLDLSEHPAGVLRYDCLRGPTLVGAILIAPDAKGANPPPADMHSFNIVIGVVLFLYNRLVSVNLLANSHAPIDFLQSVSDFYEEIKLMTQVASGMYAGALRELRTDGPGLATIFAWNPDVPTGSGFNSSWDIDDYTEFQCFRDAVTQKKPQVIEDKHGTATPFLERPEQRNIVSAVFCPVLVGAEVFGVLSFGLPVPYRYLNLELDGFMVLANAVGVAIHNFRQAAAESVEVSNSVALSTVFTAVAVAQAARHAAKVHIDTSNLKMAEMRLVIGNKVQGEIRARLLSDLTELSTYSARVTKSLDDIKAAARPPSSEQADYSLRQIWDEAIRQMRGKIIKEGLQDSWEGPDRIVQCFPDQLRHLFLNLIINSVDAFAERRIPGRKVIQCKILSVVNERITLRYVDNAGGLDLQGLRKLYPDSTVDYPQLIFEREISTKGDNGSGWGLFLCRRAADRHKGSINLVDYRRGITMDIELGLGLAQPQKGVP